MIRSAAGGFSVASGRRFFAPCIPLGSGLPALVGITDVNLRACTAQWIAELGEAGSGMKNAADARLLPPEFGTREEEMHPRKSLLWAGALAVMVSAGVAPASADVQLQLNLGGPGYSLGFSNFPQYVYLAPPPGYAVYYPAPLYAQYVIWQYYPQLYYRYYAAPPPPPPYGAPPPPRPPRGAPPPPPPDRFFRVLGVAPPPPAPPGRYRPPPGRWLWAGHERGPEFTGPEERGPGFHGHEREGHPGDRDFRGPGGPRGGPGEGPRPGGGPHPGGPGPHGQGHGPHGFGPDGHGPGEHGPGDGGGFMGPHGGPRP
ncbi:translation initiation factor IF-2 [Acidithiobacillus caldus]